MDWIFLTFTAAIIEAVSNVFDRFILKNENRDTTILLILWGFFAAVLFCPPAIISGTLTFAPAAIISGFINAAIYLLAYHFYYKAIKSEEVDRIAPVLGVNPVIVLIFATILFGEIHTPYVYFGIGLIIAGVLINSIKFKKHHNTINKQAFFWMFLAGALFASKNIIGKFFAINSFHPLDLLFWIGLNCAIITVFIFIFYRHKFHFKKATVAMDNVLAATLAAASSSIYTAAILIGPSAQVAFLHRTEIIFVFIISEILYRLQPKILRTKFNKKAFFQKLIGVTLILVGGYLLI